jgi:predicted porin
MNKKLIALAVAGACVAPAAMAQTANPVTLYGRVYVTFESIEAKGGTAAQDAVTTRRNRLDDQSSLLGVRGTEDLGGGLKAFFQLETQFKAEQNDTTFAARNSGVGLQGGWGSLLLGRWDMPMKTTVIALDPFGDLTAGGYKTTMADRGNFDVRAQNVIQYWSPSWAGIGIRLATTTNETRTATVNPRMQGASLTYTGGPVYIVGAYEEHKDGTSASTTAGLTPGTAGYREKGYALGGSFNIAMFKIGALYEKFKKDGRTDQKAWMGNLIWTLGNNQLIYQHGTAKDGGVRGATAAEPDCKSDTFGYQYNFSRRTFFLAQYVNIKNNTTSTCNLANTAMPGMVAGQDPRALSLGLRHVF